MPSRGECTSLTDSCSRNPSSAIAAVLLNSREQAKDALLPLWS